MSMDLAELGAVLCDEFDQRELELKTIQLETRTKVKRNQEELAKLSQGDRENQMKARKIMLDEANSLLNKYRADRATLAKSLKANEASQIGEMISWAKEREEEMKGWYKAARYMLRKSEEPTGEHKAGGYKLRKRTGR